MKDEFADLCPCVECEGLHPYSAMSATSVDPDGDPICPACVENLKLRKREDRNYE